VVTAGKAVTATKKAATKTIQIPRHLFHYQKLTAETKTNRESTEIKKKWDPPIRHPPIEK